MFSSDQQGQTIFIINLVSNLFNIYISWCFYYHLACCSSLHHQGPSSLSYFPVIKLQKKNYRRKTPKQYLKPQLK